MERGRLLPRPRPRPPRVPLGRVLVVPLVPRHGARVVRRSRDRRADERTVRQRQGRPRGAARRRRRLHASGAGAHRARRLAHERVVHPGRTTVLRRHVLPERRSARDAVVRARVRGGCRGLARTPGRGPRARGTAHRGDRRTGHAARRPGRLLAAAVARGLRQRRRRVRAELRRFRFGAQVPAVDDARVPAAAPTTGTLRRRRSR